MVIFKKAKDITAYINEQVKGGKKIHFVPTMGSLHEGHISLIEKAKEDNALVVVSIFVNPTQFNDKNDFENYPVNQAEDIKLLLEAPCDAVFMPSVKEMYPEGYEKHAEYEIGVLDEVLEGKLRPGHFAGVWQIVNKLLQIIKPDIMYLGQKDYQQCMVIKKMLQQQKTINTKLEICPTVREQDGLAMSSRNKRLTEAQRTLAGIIYQCLVSIQAKQKTDTFEIVQKECINLLKDKGFEPEYVSLAEADNLQVLSEYDGNKKMIALIAAKIGSVRLIDNMPLN